MNKCPKCNGLHFRTDPCRKPKESAAATQSKTSRSGTANENPPADTIQKPKHKDRHKPGYMAAYLRKWRRGEVGNKYKKEIGK